MTTGGTVNGYRTLCGLATVVLAWLLTVTAACAQSAGGRPTGQADGSLARVTEGTLWWRTSAQASAAPMLATNVVIRVTGIVVRAVVRQEFVNPAETWAEGIYVFPLPDDAAVDRLRMQLGDRLLEGQIQERHAAKQAYARAREHGQRASLVEQERPNVFTASVANVPPGETVSIEIEYQHVLRFDQGQLQLRFPMVVGARHIPGTGLSSAEPPHAARTPGASPTHGMGWAPDTDEVPDASKITPPVRRPDLGAINPVTVRIELDAGVPLARLASPSHRIQIIAEGDDRYLVTLAGDVVPADRDLVLDWAPAEGTVPAVAMAAETTPGGSFAFLMVLPPAVDALPPGRRLPREVIFVIDTSGSMHGTAIEQAKAALALALTRLAPPDRFNVIQFNSRTHALFPEARPATPDNRALAERYVAGLRAGGSTEMRPALTVALDGVDHRDRLRQVIFLTDGLVGNEERLFATIRERLGESRLFTIGIGSAPNSHFMREAARLGRGTFTFIASTSEVRARMEALFRKLELPALTDLALELPGGTPAEMFPARIPDLYLGEPLLISLRADALPVRAVLRGRLGTTPWEQELWLQDVHAGAGLSVHWARQKIAALLDERRTGRPDDEIRAAVLAVALEHHLVSPFTSLVAVDVTPVRPAAEPLARHAIETNLPHDGDATAIASLGQGATAGPVHLTVGLMALLLAASIALTAHRRPAAGAGPARVEASGRWRLDGPTR